MPANRYSSYRRPAPALPDPDTLPFPANLIVGCSDCGLRLGCSRPVPGANINRCGVMLVGQNPGKNEDLEGRPFVGQAGQYLDSLLFQCGVHRDAVCITNLVKCLTVGNRQPITAETRACSKWLAL